jgi:hypothetical protein
MKEKKEEPGTNLPLAAEVPLMPPVKPPKKDAEIMPIDRRLDGRNPKPNEYGIMMAREGKTAYKAIWSVKLAPAEIEMLKMGISPLVIRPQALQYYERCSV